MEYGDGVWSESGFVAANDWLFLCTLPIRCQCELTMMPMQLSLPSHYCVQMFCPTTCVTTNQIFFRPPKQRQHHYFLQITIQTLKKISPK